MRATKSGWFIGVMAAAALSTTYSPSLLANPARTVPLTMGQPLVLNAGDSAVITLVLTTTDPNEDGEGEIGFISGTANGISCAKSVTNYNTPAVLDCGPVPLGETLTLESGIIGYDGDELLTGAAQINTPNAVRKTQPEIDALEANAHSDEFMAQMYDTVEFICQTSASAQLICLLRPKNFQQLAGFMRANAYLLAALAADPPDSNYTQVATPVVSYYPPMNFVGEIPQNVADDLNALYANYQQQAGLLFAAYTSLNRASGALQAGMTDWQKVQVAAATKYGYQLGTVMRLEPTLSAALQADLVADGITVPTASVGQAFDVDQMFLTSGLPSEEQAILAKIGLTADDIQNITNASFVQSTTAIAALLSTPDGSMAWANPSTNAATLTASTSLQQFAVNNGYSPIDCSAATPSVSVLWPPNHKMVPVSIGGIVDPDGSTFSVAITSIQQDEPLDGQSVDGAGIGTPIALVRAERKGNGNGRIYQIGFSATDTSGADCTGSVQVSVPHDPNRPAVDSGARYSSTGQ